MKVFKTKIKSNLNNNSIDVTSPSGNTITVYDQQLQNTTLNHTSLFYRLFKKNETVELTSEELKKLLELSKRPFKKLKTVMFVKFGKRMPFTMEFNDEKHENNYIAAMERKGYTYIGIQDV